MFTRGRLDRDRLAEKQWDRAHNRDRNATYNKMTVAQLRTLAPRGNRRMGANPHANGGRLLKPLVLPSFADYALPVKQPSASAQPGVGARAIGMCRQ